MADAHALAHDWFPRPLPRNVELGEGTWLYSAFAFLHCASEREVALRTGAHCGIYNGCFFDLDAGGSVDIGDYTTLVGVIVASSARVSIGSYCFFAHEVVIADGPVATPPQANFARASRAGVTVEDDVWVGMGAVLLGGARIGRGSIVGAGAVVDRDIPPYSIVAGNPCRIVGAAPHAERA